MESYSSLADLIEALEQGTRYHISVEFLNRSLIRKFRLSRQHTIHATDFCNAVKSRPGGLDRCLECKRKAMEKLRRDPRPFAGFCTYGSYEYCYPVIRNGGLYCVIFLGNILKDPAVITHRSGIVAQDGLLQTMETQVDMTSLERICEVLESYIQMLLDSTLDGPQERTVNTSIATIKAYVDSYFFLDITLEGLAKLYHYNEKYLGSLFKRQTGKSFHAYLNDHRLGHAKNLLRTTQENILSVAEHSGFNNVTYFNRVFKGATGITPTQYRANLQVEKQEE